jgi:CPA1 family monovalent cation:H+ antiporter
MVMVTLGGLAIGIAVAWVMIKLFPYVEDPIIEILLSLMAPAATYILAEEFGVSGILSTVACGLYLGWMTPRVQTAGTRIRSRAIWDLTVQVVNGMVFILMGITIGQLRPDPTAGLERIFFQSAAILLAMIGARFLWVFVELGIYHLSRRNLNRPVNWQESIFIAWTGLRGVVSLATALALPLTIANGDPFPHRTDIILITANVIVVSLVGFGLPLPWLMRKLHLADDGSVEREYDIAKRAAMSAIGQRLDIIRNEDPVLYHQMEPLFFRVKAIADHSHTTSEDVDAALVDELMDPGVRLREEMIASAREAVLLLRDNGTIGDEARRRVEQTLDLEELRINS